MVLYFASGTTKAIAKSGTGTIGASYNQRSKPHRIFQRTGLLGAHTSLFVAALREVPVVLSH